MQVVCIPLAVWVGAVSRRLNVWATRMGISILMVPESEGILHYCGSGITLGIFSFCRGPV